MKAIMMDQFGGPEQLRLGEHADPKVAPGEVLIRVKAAGINPVDWKLGAGYLDGRMEIRYPLIPGWDVSGVVDSVGLDVDEFAVGDEVMGYIRKDTVELGAYAEFVAAHVRMLAHKPAALDWAQAAGLPLAGLTAYQSLRRVHVGQGDTVLVHAAAGGVGSLATQIAVSAGARVLGTASENNHAFLRELGAEPVAHGEGLVSRVRNLVANGVDVALDFVGGDAVETSRELVRDRTRIASITDTAAADYGGQYVWVRPDATELTHLAHLADEGNLTVPIAQALPLSEAAEGWRRSQSGRTRGKLVLAVDEQVPKG